MTSSTQHLPANAILRGVGTVTSGLSLRVHDAQPIGAPALRGDFTLLSEDAAHTAAMETHLGDDISHRAFLAVQSALPKSGQQGNFDDVHAALVAAVGTDPMRMAVINENLLGRHQWKVELVGPESPQLLPGYWIPSVDMTDWPEQTLTRWLPSNEPLTLKKRDTPDEESVDFSLKNERLLVIGNQEPKVFRNDCDVQDLVKTVQSMIQNTRNTISTTTSFVSSFVSICAYTSSPKVDDSSMKMLTDEILNSQTFENVLGRTRFGYPSGVLTYLNEHNGRLRDNSVEFVVAIY